MQFKTSIVLFLLIVLLSCSLENKNEIVSIFLEKKDETRFLEKKDNTNFLEKRDESKINEFIKEKSKKETIIQPKKIDENTPFYYVGEPYFIENIEYIPVEDYNYNKTGLASYYGSNLHRKKTVNNEYNKVTELFARHRTLPLPSVVKITNLENGLSLLVRVNDRGPRNNAIIIEVSRKVAQLLRFYKTKIAKVRVEIIADPSKQLKIVTQTMTNSDFDATLNSAPTENVTVTDLDGSVVEESKLRTNYEQPIELGLEEEISQSELFVKITGFSTYQDAQNLKYTIQGNYKITAQKENKEYSIIIGPMLNQDADNLFQILISKGYKQPEIIIK